MHSIVRQKWQKRPTYDKKYSAEQYRFHFHVKIQRNYEQYTTTDYRKCYFRPRA